MAKIFFLMGVSGSGKTTVLNESGIIDDNNFVYVPSYTTRPMRPGEKQGVKYFHITKETFEKDIAKGAFLEYALVHQTQYYGTKYNSLIQPLNQGISPIKELDIYGLEKIQKEGKIKGKYITIFLDIPEKIMKERIRQRAEISIDELENRLHSASFEREKAKELCDYIIDASQTLEHVVEAFLRIVKPIQIH